MISALGGARAVAPPIDYEQARRYAIETVKCQASPQYFIEHYVHIYDSVARSWIPFSLWQAQKRALDKLHNNNLNAWLKARQLGMSWLALAYALWQALFVPIADILVFSAREQEAKYLIGSKRLMGMIERLPDWMKPKFEINDKLHKRLANGSDIRAFPSNRGDSYTATLAIVDEADLVPNLSELLDAVKPTIEAGGKLLLLSRANKLRPVTAFKEIFKNAIAGRNQYVAEFFAWYAHPNRDQAWYERTKSDLIDRPAIGNQLSGRDSLLQLYPSTPQEALQGAIDTKRIDGAALELVYDKRDPIVDPKRFDGQPVPNQYGRVLVYQLPQKGERYVGGVDSAGGAENSDDTSITIVNKRTGQEAAHLSGKIDPDMTAQAAHDLAAWYNNAGLMIERNNHGHAVLLWFTYNGSGSVAVLDGYDKQAGWHSTGNGAGRGGRGKVMLYNGLAGAVRERDCLIHTFKTYSQIASIDRATLRAPDPMPDDASDSFALAMVAREYDFEPFSDVW